MWTVGKTTTLYSIIEYLNRPESKFNGDVASDFYHKWKEDIEYIEKYNSGKHTKYVFLIGDRYT